MWLKDVAQEKSRVPPNNSLASADLHAGVNAYISPTTFSAFYGALEPRFGRRGSGLVLLVFKGME